MSLVKELDEPGLNHKEGAMERSSHKDSIDWHGCPAVQFNPNKLGGRATVGSTRMDADGVVINFEGGMTAKEISEDFGVDLKAVLEILAFSMSKRIRVA